MYGLGDVIQEYAEDEKRLKAEVEKLKKKVKLLKKENEELKAELSSYKAGCVPSFDGGISMHGGD
jgi:phage shock protein A